MSTTHEPTGIYDGVTVPIWWSMLPRSADWHRQCIADREWCRIFLYVFRYKTGINLDKLYASRYASRFMRNVTAATAQHSIWCLLFYIAIALLVTGLFVGASLGYMHFVKWFSSTWVRSRKTQADNGNLSDYYQLKSVRIEKGDKVPLIGQDKNA